MLYNRQAKPGAPTPLGTALIHPRESFEYSRLTVLRDSDAVILHGQNGAARFSKRDIYRYMAAWLIVLDAVIAEVLNHLIQNLTASHHHGLLARYA